MRAAYNADKSALAQRVQELEKVLRAKDTQYNDLIKRLDKADLYANVQCNELNFWQGNVNTMRRDMDMQLQFNQQLADENKNLKNDVDSLKTHLQMKDREQNLLTKQIRALHEDNERIVAMYKMVQNTPPSKGAKGNDEEVNEAPTLNSEMAETKKNFAREQAAKAGWQTVKDEFGGASAAFGGARRKDDSHQESKETIKRN